MNKLTLWIVLATLSCACHEESEVGQDVGGVAIYLAENTWEPSQTPVMPAFQDLTLLPTPWIASSDIAFYDFSTHLLYLREGASVQENNLDKRIFVVVANGKKRYAGIFLPAYSNYLPLGSAVIHTQPKFYPDDVVHIDFLADGTNKDPRTDTVLREALTENHQFQPGLSCILTEVSGISENGQINYSYDLHNLGYTSLYVLDPDKMGEPLFHYFTNGVILQNEIDIYWAENRKVTSPNPPDHWEKDWLTLLKSDEVIHRTVHMDGFQEVQQGIYNCAFTFPSINHIERSNRTLEEGQIWLGEVSDTRAFAIP